MVGIVSRFDEKGPLNRRICMGSQSLILFLVVGIVAGWLAGRIMRGGGFGLIGDLIVGVIGAFIGGWLFGVLGISVGGILGLLLAAVVGAMALLFVARLIKQG
jgi:uncharacterized membrane protein YeaQ/YmgE (transglycosylase-associated protein family)